MNHRRSTSETPADRYVPAGHSGQIRGQEQYAGSSKGLALVPHRAQSLWRHHPCPGATAAPPDNFRNRQALPGQLTRTTGSPGGPAAARHGPRAELRSYPIPVLRPACESHPLQHDWLPRAEFWTARLARPIAASLQTRSRPRRVRQCIATPRNGCYARLNPPAQPWPHVYGIGDQHPGGGPLLAALRNQHSSRTTHTFPPLSQALFWLSSL